MQNGYQWLRCEVAKVLAAAQMPLTPERYIWACASTLMQQHGNDAWFHASKRADELFAECDFAGHAMFGAILARIEELEKMAP